MGRRGCCINDLRDKEVVNICDGRILGYVDDVEVDINSGRLVAIIVPCSDKLLSFSKGRDIVILWENIEKIGDDTILVKVDEKEYNFHREHEIEKQHRKRAFF